MGRPKSKVEKVRDSGTFSTSLTAQASDLDDALVACRKAVAAGSGDANLGLSSERAGSLIV
jgi:hypothetical protein